MRVDDESPDIFFSWGVWGTSMKLIDFSMFWF